MNLYIDAEWFPNQKIFLIGYARENGRVDQLYSRHLNEKNFRNLLDSTRGYVYFYGPDIGMCEKHFDFDIRSNYKCVNLLRITRTCFPKSTSWKLAHMEKKLGLSRRVAKYKKSIFQIYDDWKDPKYRERVLLYNEDDVKNLVKVKQKLFERFEIDRQYLNSILLR